MRRFLESKPSVWQFGCKRPEPFTAAVTQPDTIKIIYMTKYYSNCNCHKQADPIKIWITQT